MQTKSRFILMSILFLLVCSVSGMAAFNEAPMLAERVASGELPPVEERLPKNPLVLTQELNDIPSEDMVLEIGQYGGTMRLADPAAEGGAAPEVWCFSNEAPLMTPGIDTLGEWDKGKLVGNWLESWEANEDSTEFTFVIREGLRWSDGHPVTTEDVRFRFEDVMFNTDLTTRVPDWFRANYRAGGAPGSVEIIDEYEFTISFDEPYPLFPVFLANRWNNPGHLMLPKHYLSQFHITYTSIEEMRPLLEEEGFEDDEWHRLYASKGTFSGQHGPAAIDHPSLQPWIYTGQPVTGVFAFERNPYYYKVDAEGNQLPYIDRLEIHWITDLAMQTMKIIAGEVDFAVNRTNVTDFPLFKENEESGGYLVEILYQHVTPTDVFLNLTYEDEVWREVVRDLRFRQALNYAIDRENIIEAVQLGFGSLPYRSAVPFEYSPDRANELLDEMGMDQRDSAGWRLGPDGRRFEIPFEIAIWTVGSDRVTEMVVDYWQAVGIYTTMRVIDMSLASTRREANDIRAQNFWMDWGVAWELNPIAFHSSLNVIMNDWGIMWRNWYLEMENAEEPPEEVKEFIYGMETVIMSLDHEERQEAMDSVRQLLYDNIFYFPIAESGYPMVFNENMGNIPVGTEFGISAAYSGAQFFYRQ